MLEALALMLAPRILGGSPSSAGEDAAVLLEWQRPAGERFVCTGALIAPRLVLTARHCVASVLEDPMCLADGTPLPGGVGGVGGMVKEQHAANELVVYTGTTRPLRERVAARGSEILHDGAANTCNHDIALVVLDTAIEGVPIAALRIDGDVTRGERLTAVGWGITNEVDEPFERQHRSVVAENIGPHDAYPLVPPNELTFEESICSGDSGGPIFSVETGAVVALASRGGNGGPASQSQRASCVGALNYGTKLAPFHDLFDRGFARAGAAPVLETRPEPETCGICTAAPPDRRSTRAPFTGLLLALAALVRRRGKR